MSEFSFVSAFLVGLAGGVHCIGMCGGVSVALASAIPENKPGIVYSLAYNFGRIFSYIMAGAITGAMAQIVKQYVPLSGPLLAIFSGIMLITMACYLANWWRGLVRIEAIGAHLWRHIQPLAKRFLPFRTPLHAVPYGIIWGWLPCGLVYSTLTWALASGSAVSGAVIMAGFGLGTLPTLLATWAGANWILRGFKKPMVRHLIALSLLMYALFILWRAIGSF